MKHKRLYNRITAACLCTVFAICILHTFTGIAAVFAAPAATSTDPTLTVVGKRITGDDTYFEISLEVNGNHEDFTDVGVVLRYDPSIIVPAASWDDNAAAADMKDCTTWSNRRALPTLGIDTWALRNAFVYQTEGTESEPSVGYLYLGAVYPGLKSNETNADDPDAPTSAPDNALPDTTENKHDRPVVAARFMYAGDTAEKRAENKAKVEDSSKWPQPWTNASSPAPNNDAILTVATDDIVCNITPQYGFAIHKADFSRRLFLYNFVSASGGTPEDPAVTKSKAQVTTAEQAKADELEIITCEGESAKSGGLSLSDIYVIMFYDWDDTLLGSLTNGVGVDATEAVNNYVTANFVHPALQTLDPSKITSNKREDNYRGEYPYDGPRHDGTSAIEPGGTNSVNDGDKYPLTNKLEYCFAGKDLYAADDGTAYAYAGGWTAVTPTTMENTWTALDGTTNFNRLDHYKDPVLNADVTLDDAALVPDATLATYKHMDSTDKEIDMESVDFSRITSKDINGGVFYVKAVYTPGENLNSGGPLYSTRGPANYEVLSKTIDEKSTIYGISFEYRRINSSGYGVPRLKEPQVRMTLTQEGASGSTIMPIEVNNSDVINVTLTPSIQVKNIDYMLVESYGLNAVSGTSGSDDSGLGNFENKGAWFDGGFIYAATWDLLMDEMYQLAKSEITNFSKINYVALKQLNLMRVETGANKNFTSAAQLTQKKATLKNCMTKAIQEYGDAEAKNKLTYYQVQYAILKNNQYLNAQDSYDYFATDPTKYNWCIPSS